MKWIELVNSSFPFLDTVHNIYFKQLKFYLIDFEAAWFIILENIV